MKLKNMWNLLSGSKRNITIVLIGVGWLSTKFPALGLESLTDEEIGKIYEYACAGLGFLGVVHAVWKSDGFAGMLKWLIAKIEKGRAAQG